MLRLMLNDELWFKLSEIMLQHGIYDKPNLRMIVEAMLYRMRVGCPWRDLPADFGCWNSIYQQFNRWSSKNKLGSVTGIRSLVFIPHYCLIFWGHFSKRWPIASEKPLCHSLLCQLPQSGKRMLPKDLQEVPAV